MSKKTMDILQECIPVFIMLADENRQKILIKIFDDGPQSVSELTKVMELSQPAISHHLKLLKTAGLVSVTKKGREHIYDFSSIESIQLLGKLIDSLKLDFKERNKKNEII